MTSSERLTADHHRFVLEQLDQTRFVHVVQPSGSSALATEAVADQTGDSGNLSRASRLRNGTPRDYLYVSYVTLTTVGYGVSSQTVILVARAQSSRAIIGQLDLVTVVGSPLGTSQAEVAGVRLHPSSTVA